MKTFMRYTAASSVLGFALILFAAESEILRPQFDAHVHLFYGGEIQANADQVNQFITHSGLQQLFVLSDSYNDMQRNVPLEQDPRWQKNNFTAQVLEKINTPVIGLCGYRANWSDGEDILRPCLANSKMKGLKMRSQDQYYLQDEEPQRNFRSVLQQFGGQINYVLIHMSIDSSRTLIDNPQSPLLPAQIAHDEVEVATLIRVAADFPQIQFVIGHTLYSPSLVRHAARLRSELQVNNLWIETSTALNIIRGPDQLARVTADYAAAWREFGIDRIIFGSDQVLGGPPEKAELRNFNFFDTETTQMGLYGFTSEEREKIMTLNWHELTAATF